jgi:NACalpha-BTF3-like transcription factor
VAKPLFILKLHKCYIVHAIIFLSILYKFEITRPYTYKSKMTEQKIEQIITILLKYEHKLSDGYQYYVYEDTVSNVLREIAQTILAAIDTAAEVKLDEKDIELVAGQTNVSRERAIDALKKNKGDIVDAIMYLSP